MVVSDRVRIWTQSALAPEYMYTSLRMGVYMHSHNATSLQTCIILHSLVYQHPWLRIEVIQTIPIAVLTYSLVN